MPLFHRKPAAAVLDVPQAAVLCQAGGCANYNAETCRYRDRRGRSCRSAFCPEHSVLVDGVRYCRRHAGTMRALGSKGHVGAGLPDVDNRGPSLVNHIADQLDTTVTSLLRSVARADEQVLSDKEVSMAFDAERRPRWERGWRLVEATGVVIKVTLFVEQHNDSNVTVRVGSESVAEGVPPWIQHRERGETVPPSVDQSERRLFYRFIEENITASVNQLRMLADHPSWA